jgi:prefoldin alpha subunit
LSTDTAEAKAQSLALQGRLLEEYYSDLIARENILTRLLIENRNSAAALEVVDDTQDVELAIPIGGGANIPVVLRASQKILVNVSKDVVIEKSKAETLQYLTERSKEIESALRDLLRQKEETGQRIENIRNQIAQLELAMRQQG